MSSEMQQIKLYEHNRCAYEAALDMLEAGGRACIVHPTGTGKSFIGFKYVLDHPGEKVLWLGPSNYIFDAQADALVGSDGTMPENLTRMTYSQLWTDAEGGVALPTGVDLVILDEFHRAGAPCWGQGVGELLEANPDAKVLGLSATPVRYSDSGRNMADELFGGEVAAEMTLAEAWLRGILPKPKYVTGIYSASDALDGLRVRIEDLSDGDDRSELMGAYERLRRRVVDADGLPEVFAKHMTRRNPKLIVFCPSFAVLEEIEGKLPSWLSGVSDAVRAYRVLVADPSSRDNLEAFKADDGDAARVVLCIDQLNEGVHVPGVDGVVFARPTGSPAVYMQQLGRALETGSGSEPLVFDLCNNIASLGGFRDMVAAAAAKLAAEGVETVCDPEDFDIADEFHDWVELSEMIDRAASKWRDVGYCVDYLIAHPAGGLDDER